MQHGVHKTNSKYHADSCPSNWFSKTSTKGISRRNFLGGLAGVTAISGLKLAAATQARNVSINTVSSGVVLPHGKTLRIKPVLTYKIERRQEKTSWRSYGGVQTQAIAKEEAGIIKNELKKLASKAEFPIEVLPVALVDNDQKADAVAGEDFDVLLLYAASGNQVYKLAATNKPTIMFVRHKSGHHYLWYEIAHWRFLRRNGDIIKETNMDVDDIVVDDYSEILWRLRALYGLKTPKARKCLPSVD